MQSSCKTNRRSELRDGNARCVHGARVRNPWGVFGLGLGLGSSIELCIPAAAFFLRPPFLDAAFLLPLSRPGVGGCSLGSRDWERVERVARAGALAGTSCGVPRLWRLAGLADAVDETLAMTNEGLRVDVDVYLMGCDGMAGGGHRRSQAARSCLPAAVS